MKCINCNEVELTGRQVEFCGDKCRKQWNRQTRTVPRSNSDKLNWGAWMDTGELARAGLVANRVPIPGDSDYVRYTETVHSNPRPLPSYQLPDGVTKPTGAMSDATRVMSGQELNQRANYCQGTDWIASPEYAEIIYRLMTGQVDGLWLPSWYGIREAG